MALIRTTLLFSILCMAVLCAKADTIEFTTYYPNKKICEQYEINKRDSTRVGYYKRFDSKGLLVTAGQYADNKRSGVWIFYNGSSEYERYNFDNFREITFEDRYEDREGYPHFPGGIPEFACYIREMVLRVLSADKMSVEAGTGCKVVFTLSKDAIITDVKIGETGNTVKNANIEGVIIAAVKSSPKWIPSRRSARINSHSDFSVTIEF